MKKTAVWKVAFVAAVVFASAMLAQAQEQASKYQLRWVEPQLASVPSARCCYSMTYDSATRSVLLFGGGNGGVVPRVTYNDTWIWRNGWFQKFPATSPSARQGAGMAYDPTTGTVVLFGGSDVNQNTLNDTWIWNGVTWTQQFPPVSPPGREWDIQGMVYDPNSETVVLFGGFTPSTGALGDTWEWNGRTKTWTQQFPSSSPQPRRTALAYDATRKNIVLFGGDNAAGDCCNTYYHDTWTWNGATWTQQFPPASPPARTDAALAYDPILKQVVLFGGFNRPGQGLDDTWTWDGTTWLQRQTTIEPGGRWALSMSFDPSDLGLLLFGGEITGDPFVNETWFFGPVRVP